VSPPPLSYLDLKFAIIDPMVGYSLRRTIWGTYPE